MLCSLQCASVVTRHSSLPRREFCKAHLGIDIANNGWYNIHMAQNILCISEFATKVVAGFAGLVFAVLIAIVVIVVHKKRG